MSRQQVANALKRKHKKWTDSIEDEAVRKLAQKNSYITGGAILSLLQGEEPNDYDIYFTDKETTLAVVRYYAEQWNKTHSRSVEVQDVEGRVRVYVASKGIVSEDEEDQRAVDMGKDEEKLQQEKEKRKPYRPRFMSSNAITLSDDVQLVFRFYGQPEEVHKNFDFIHCTMVFKPIYAYRATGNLILPAEALEALIFKQLTYVGSRYPLASVLRAKKFIKRGWKINAGQYLKMIMQLQELNLKDFNVLEEQLTGVDFYYFMEVIETIRAKQEAEPDFNIDSTYMMEVIDKVFDGKDEEAE